MTCFCFQGLGSEKVSFTPLQGLAVAFLWVAEACPSQPHLDVCCLWLCSVSLSCLFGGMFSSMLKLFKIESKLGASLGYNNNKMAWLSSLPAEVDTGVIMPPGS